MLDDRHRQLVVSPELGELEGGADSEGSQVDTAPGESCGDVVVVVLVPQGAGGREGGQVTVSAGWHEVTVHDYSEKLQTDAMMAILIYFDALNQNIG